MGISRKQRERLAILFVLPMVMVTMLGPSANMQNIHFSSLMAACIPAWEASLGGTKEGSVVYIRVVLAPSTVIGARMSYRKWRENKQHLI